MSLVEAADEVLDEERHVVAAVTERRKVDREDAEAVVQVAPEGAGLDHAGEIAVGGGDQPHVDPPRYTRAERPHFAILNDAEELCLQRERQVLHLVEEERAAVGEVQRARSLLERTREGTARMAEELALRERLGHRRTVHRHEGARGTPAESVHGTRDDFLAGAGLPLEQQMRFRVRGRPHERADLVHRATPADQGGESVSTRGRRGERPGSGGRRPRARQTGDGLDGAVDSLAVAQHDVVRGTGLHRLDGGVGCVPRAHDDDGDVGTARTQHAEDAGVVAGAEDDEASPCVFHRRDRIAGR